MNIRLATQIPISDLKISDGKITLTSYTAEEKLIRELTSLGLPNEIHEINRTEKTTYYRLKWETTTNPPIELRAILTREELDTIADTFYTTLAYYKDTLHSDSRYDQVKARRYFGWRSGNVE